MGEEKMNKLSFATQIYIHILDFYLLLFCKILDNLKFLRLKEQKQIFRLNHLKSLEAN